LEKRLWITKASLLWQALSCHGVLSCCRPRSDRSEVLLDSVERAESVLQRAWHSS
jgi:hypothetical protein